MRSKSSWTARFSPVLLLLVSLVVARGLVFVSGSTESLVQFFPLKCPIRTTTGIPCPTCGLGHALVDAWVGRWESSLREHPLGLATLFLSTALTLSYLVRPEGVRGQIERLGRALANRPRLLISAAIIYLLIGVIRAFLHLSS